MGKNGKNHSNTEVLKQLIYIKSRIKLSGNSLVTKHKHLKDERGLIAKGLKL